MKTSIIFLLIIGNIFFDFWNGLVSTVHTSYDNGIYLAISAGGFQVQGRGIPRRIKKLNKSLGLDKNSEVVWDILSISNLTSGLSDVKVNISNTI